MKLSDLRGKAKKGIILENREPISAPRRGIINRRDLNDPWCRLLHRIEDRGHFDIFISLHQQNGDEFPFGGPYKRTRVNTVEFSYAKNDEKTIMSNGDRLFLDDFNGDIGVVYGMGVWTHETSVVSGLVGTFPFPKPVSVSRDDRVSFSKNSFLMEIPGTYDIA